MKQPFCRWCGKPIPKRTAWKILETNPENMKYIPDSKVLVERLPQTKTEAQALFNERVLSVKRHKFYEYANDSTVDKGIDQVTLWDGETYVDKYFCSRTTCAVSMGYSAAVEHSFGTKAYRDAVAAAEKKEEAVS